MKWLHTTGWYVDGIVAKNSRDAYIPGERVMQNKRIRTADWRCRRFSLRP